MGKHKFEGRGRFRGGFGRGNFNRGSSSSFRGNFGSNYGRNNYRGKSDWQQRPRRETPGKRLTEVEIGVTEYISEHEGFQGIIKTRYSDFQVSEINLKGEVAQLTDLNPPKPPPEQEVLEDEDLLTLKYNIEILSMDMWNRINKVVIGADDAEEKIEIDVTTSTKEERTKIHEAVKKAFGDALVGSTVTVDDKKYVRFEKYRKGVRIDTRIKWIWPGDYVYFIVHKENCDTMDAAVRIAERLRMHIKPSMFGYAGTKDRRAKTSQWFSVRRVDPSKLAQCCRDMRDIRLGNYSFHKEILKLGMLSGNKFRIALRNVNAPEEQITKACEALKTKGFLNYYGLQRFGTKADIPTFMIGKSLLKGDFKQAIEYVLSESDGDQYYYKRGPEAALRAALNDNPNDLQTALYKVPRNTRLLYVHSYQSLIWNRAVSERVRRYGLKPAVGDLVPAAALPLTEESDEEEQNDDDKIDQNNEQISETKNKKQNNTEEKAKVPVKVLTQDDIDSGNYTIFDVIMPLPGYNIEYPHNMRDYYEELLAEDGLTTELRNKNKSYNMSGAYRRIVVLPSDMSWELVRYTDPYADLIASDLDMLQGKQLTGIIPDGKYSALLLTLTLPVSSYATMALRELLRVNTSAESQAAHNQYHKSNDDDVPPEKKQKVDE